MNRRNERKHCGETHRRRDRVMKFDSDPNYEPVAAGDDERDVDLGVHSVNRTAMIAAMIRIAAAGLPNLAMSFAPVGT